MLMVSTQYNRLMQRNHLLGIKEPFAEGVHAFGFLFYQCVFKEERYGLHWSDIWWLEKASSASNNRRHQTLPTNNGTQIKLILVDDASKGERHIFDIGTSTTLDVLSNGCADKRGVLCGRYDFSLRASLHFWAVPECEKQLELDFAAKTVGHKSA